MMATKRIWSEIDAINGDDARNGNNYNPKFQAQERQVITSRNDDIIN